MRSPHPGSAGWILLACLLLPTGVRADDWPQWFGPQRDGVWREKGIVEKFPKGGPKELWRTPIGGGYAGPAVADGRVYVTDRVLGKSQKEADDPFAKANSTGQERVLCLDAKSGKILWVHKYDCKYTMSYPAGPRATPIVAGGKVYTLGAMGDLFCLDTKNGDVLWTRNLMKDYKARVPVWGFSAPPLLDGDQLICLVGRAATVVSFDKDTGKEKWKALSLENADIGYAPPMIFTFGGKRQLVIWHPESVNGLDPTNGKVLWTHEWAVTSNLTISTPRQVGNRLFLTSFYNGCRMLEVSGNAEGGVKELFRSKGRGEQPKLTDKLHSIMSTPVIAGEHIYGVCSYGELRCLTLDEGKRVWSELTASGAGTKPERWANAFIVPHGNRYFLFNEKGDLIIAKLTPEGYEEIDRANILAPTGQLGGKFTPARKVVWSHPAFANRAVFARNDKEIVAVSLAAE